MEVSYIFNNEIIRLELELTNYCNLKCPLCLRNTHPELKGNSKIEQRDFEDLINQLDSFPKLKYVTLAGAISEPASYDRLFDLLDYLAKRKIEVSLFINGDLRNDVWYKKLAIKFQKLEGHIYFTICGSTQELHEKYRIGSDLETVLRRVEIVKKYSRKEILTYIIFDYNQEDFNKNYKKYQKKFNTHFFYTLPFQEHFNSPNIPGIHLPKNLQDVYKKLDRLDDNIDCPSLRYGFRMIDFKGNVNLCSLEKIYGDSHCWECSVNNSKILRESKIYRIAEGEDEESEEELYVNK